MTYPYEPLYIEYLVYFNRDRNYFECHEAMEQAWLKYNRMSFYKGLLQVAVGFYHFRRGNARGSHMMFDSAATQLTHYPAVFEGIDLHQLLQQSSRFSTLLKQKPVASIAYEDVTIHIQDVSLYEAYQQQCVSLPVAPMSKQEAAGHIGALRQRD